MYRFDSLVVNDIDQKLNCSDIRVCGQQVRREAVAKAMDAGALVDLGSADGFFEGPFTVESETCHRTSLPLSPHGHRLADGNTCWAVQKKRRRWPLWSPVGVGQLLAELRPMRSVLLDPESTPTLTLNFQFAGIK